MKEKPIPGWIKPLVLTGILLLFVIVANSRLGSLPPSGKFWNPFSGFWRNAESDHSKDRDLHIPGLHETVTVVFNERGVPHIFAQNTHDLYMAQGYVTARDRLWQMEIQARSAEGRLAEILGPALVEHDRFQRRLGIPKGAERDLGLVKRDADSWEAASAYSKGVNAYIRSLRKSQYPLEYKLLDYAPQRWTPLNTTLLIKHMQWTLSGGGDDLPLTNTLGKFGAEFLRKFYPVREPGLAPVIPAGTTWNFVAAKTPDPKPDSTSVQPPSPGQPLPLMLPGDTSIPVPAKNPDPGNGSNNFVLAGAKSQSGHPILANDPHLDLGLPSIWYELQLSAPGISVYGVSLPGAPAILIGFNRKIAWGLTNGSDDVFDWYRITFKDSSLSEYLHAGQWKTVRKDVEPIQVRGAVPVLDTVIFIHHGPLVLKSQEKPMNRNSPSMHALRWLALEPSDELQSILKIMKSSNYEEFSSALSPFACPSQNFAFASVDGDIAMFHHGRFPRRWNGQGRFIMDGTLQDNDWSGWIPENEEPRTLNPTQGWLASANQAPVDSTYPHYLGSNYLNGERAQRLSKVMAESDSVTSEQAFGILRDDYNLHAAEVLPTLLQKLAHTTFSSADSASLKLLTQWDYRHDPEKAAPALFDQWWRQLHRGIWHDEFGDDSARYQWPSQSRTRHLVLEEPNAEWYNDITTPAKENLDFLVARSFREACILARGKTWSEYRPVKIRHLARIDAFSKLAIATGGCGNCVNAQKVSHGPSWRMVVNLDQEPHGFGIYPGGQSGNPGSPHYDDFIGDWAAGRHYDLKLLHDPSATGMTYSLQLRGK